MSINKDEFEYNYGLSLSIRIYGLRVDPDFVTNILNIEPTSSRKINEVGVLYGRDALINLTPAKTNIWSYSTKRIDDSEFNDHWCVLYEQIKGKENAFMEVKKYADDIILSANIGVNRFVPGLEISPGILRIISDFGLRLDLDVIL